MFVFMAPTAFDGASSDLVWHFARNPVAPGVLTVASPTSASLFDATTGITVEFIGSGFSAFLGMPLSGSVSQIRAYINGVLQVTADPDVPLSFTQIRNSAFAAVFDNEANAIYSNAADDVLQGGNQDDQILTFAGNDTMIGGFGHDGFQVGDADASSGTPAARALRVHGGDGFDSVSIIGNYGQTGAGLANLTGAEFYSVEFLSLSPGASVRVDAVQFLLNGHLGNVIRSSGSGALEVNLGVLNSFDFDTLSYQIFTGTHRNRALGNANGNVISGADAWSDTLFGGAGDDSLSGRGGDDRLAGDAGNDTLSGGAGIDTLAGGAGNDVYRRDEAQDVLFEKLDAGTDLVLTSIDYTAGANIENATATGTAGIMLRGNALANTLTGNSGYNRLQGGDGNDSLRGMDGNDTINAGAGNDLVDGGLGIDRMLGGVGNDTLYVNSSADVVIELANEGLDMVVTTVGLTMADHVEYARLVGNAGFLHGNGLDNWVQGNALANIIHGNGGNDAIYAGTGNDQVFGGDGNDILGGGEGNDTFTGGAGSDRFLGEAGNDLFVFSDGEGIDYVGNFTNGGTEADVISLTGVAAITDYTDLITSHMFQFGPDVRIDLGGGNSIWLTFTLLSDLAAENFLF